MVKAFVDTNLFLHFPPPEQIDWLGLIGRGPVELLIAPVVYRELDLHKDRHPVAKLRKRARDAVSRIARSLGEAGEGDIRPDVRMYILTTEPLIDFHAHRLSESSKDDQLIATMIQCRSDADTETPLVLVTEDYLLRQKARGHSFETIPLPKELRLPAELTDDEKRLRQLEKELHRRPQLRVSFESGDDRLESSVTPVPALSEAEKQQLLDEKKRKYPLLHVPPPEPPPSPGRDPGRQAAIEVSGLERLALGMDFTAEKNAKYNEELQEYFEEYESYIDRLHRHRQRMALSLTFSVEVSNVGNAPARDIDLDIQTDADVLIFKESDKLLDPPSAPSPPTPPSPPRPMDYLSQAGLLASAPFVVPPMPSYVGGGPSFDVTRFDKGFEISAHIPKLKHTLIEEFGPFVLVFPSIDAVRPFSLSYSLNSEDVLENVEGTLHVIPRIEGP